VGTDSAADGKSGESGRVPQSASEPGGIRLLEVFELLLARWPMLVAWALLGAAAFWIYARLSPTRYRAAAAVVVDSNVDVAMPNAERLIIDSYLNQQTLQFESIAYSDAVWDVVAQAIVQEGIAEERAAALELADTTRLPHPEDGSGGLGHGRDPALVARLANTWAQAFVDTVDDGVRLAQRELALQEAQDEAIQARIRLAGESARLLAVAEQFHALEADLGRLPPDAAADPAVRQTLQIAVGQAGGVCADIPACVAPAGIADQRSLAEAVAALYDRQTAASLQASDDQIALYEELQAERDRLAEDTIGVSAVTEVAFTRSAAAPERPEPAPGWSLLVGAGIGLIAGAVVEHRRGRGAAA
jgi:hypothetical protein